MSDADGQLGGSDDDFSKPEDDEEANENDVDSDDDLPSGG